MPLRLLLLAANGNRRNLTHTLPHQARSDSVAAANAAIDAHAGDATRTPPGWMRF